MWLWRNSICHSLWNWWYKLVSWWETLHTPLRPPQWDECISSQNIHSSSPLVALTLAITALPRDSQGVWLQHIKVNTLLLSAVILNPLDFKHPFSHVLNVEMNTMGAAVISTGNLLNRTFSCHVNRWSDAPGSFIPLFIHSSIFTIKGY